MKPLRGKKKEEYISLLESAKTMTPDELREIAPKWWTDMSKIERLATHFVTKFADNDNVHVH